MRSQMHVFFLALLIAMTAENAMAGDQKYPPRAVHGAGNSSCGQWLKYRSNGDGATEFQFQAWIDGFLSGINFAGTDLPDVIGDATVYLRSGRQPVDSVAWYAWIDSYCRKNPLDPLAIAVEALREELISKMSR
jgi:hypothetical protein